CEADHDRRTRGYCSDLLERPGGIETGHCHTDPTADHNAKKDKGEHRCSSLHRQNQQTGCGVEAADCHDSISCRSCSGGVDAEKVVADTGDYLCRAEENHE